ncbi:MAG: class I SAM-dependent methyltransferase [Rhodobacteraceae bacterium]|nr:class I SAM-dependent methyltransferase [Paracoccaceae bacterium]
MTTSTNPMIAHYAERLREHGPGAKAVHWADKDSQFARFRVLCGIDDDLGHVLDVGCGLGALWDHLEDRGGYSAYTGVDIVPEFLDHLRARAAGATQVRVMRSDLPNALPGPVDYALASGIFNNAMDDNWGFLTSSLRAMWDASEKGIAFNAMTRFVDFHDPELWYVDPAEVLSFCKTELGGHPVLRHDYLTRPGAFPFEFAVYVYRTPRVG